MSLRLIFSCLFLIALGNCFDPSKGTLKFLLKEISKMHLNREIRIEVLQLSEKRNYNAFFDG
jgi:hypothetical protein